MLSDLRGNQTRAIVEPGTTPFVYNTRVQSMALYITRNCENELDRSYAIFDWITTHCQYDHEKRRKISLDPVITHRNAIETFHDRKGLCGELSTLQVVMERLVGNTAYVARLRIGGEYIATEKGDIFYDSRGRLGHVIAVNIGKERRQTLIDLTSPYGFNCHYDHFEIVRDREIK